LDLPRRVGQAVEAAAGRTIAGTHAVHGGCITPVRGLSFDDGSTAFLKWSDAGQMPAGFFRAEARSLTALAQTDSVRIPAVLGVADNWLLLEWLEPGSPGPADWGRLGVSLARMHRMQSREFGWHQDNWIGSLPQRNTRCRSWAAFWRDERIGPQWERARSGHVFDRSDERQMQQLLASFDGLLAAGDDDGPSLIHGDLWNGNAHGMADGEIALIDPSSAHAHREVDLAMAALFGGFGPDFFRSYEEAWPLADGWRQRRHAYQLYYLLVHVNLFGASYAGGARSAIRGAL
jgi:fructosamine-3-kinase